MSTTLKVGSVVVARAGGPRMTIERIETDRDPTFVKCAWFDGEAHLQRGEFVADSLKEVRE